MAMSERFLLNGKSDMSKSRHRQMFVVQRSGYLWFLFNITPRYLLCNNWQNIESWMDTDTISSGRPGAQMLTDNNESQLKDVNVKKSSASKKSQDGPNWRSVNCQLMIVNWFDDLFE